MGKSRKQYVVDWSDPPYPRVVYWYNLYGFTEDEAKTLAECKQEIVDHFEYQIMDARAAIKTAREIRVADIENANDAD